MLAEDVPTSSVVAVTSWGEGGEVATANTPEGAEGMTPTKHKVRTSRAAGTQANAIRLVRGRVSKCHSTVRSLRISRPMAPWRTGVSINRQDRSAMITMATTWKKSRVRSVWVTTVAVVRTMTG